jgi:hypothetical protein
MKIKGVRRNTMQIPFSFMVVQQRHVLSKTGPTRYMLALTKEGEPSAKLLISGNTFPHMAESGILLC